MRYLDNITFPYICSLGLTFSVVSCQFTTQNENPIMTGPIRKLNGETEPCQIDCLSYDQCVAGTLSCTTNDGRTAMCRSVQGDPF